jgi:hypothetical protein
MTETITPGSREKFFLTMEEISRDVNAARERTDVGNEALAQELFAKHGANMAAYGYMDKIVRYVTALEFESVPEPIVARFDVPIPIFAGSMQAAADLLGEPVLVTSPADLDSHFAFVPGGDPEKYDTFFANGGNVDPAQL